MDRQRPKGDREKATGTIRNEADRMIGQRHFDPKVDEQEAEERRRRDGGKAMDAIRDVVNRQK